MLVYGEMPFWAQKHHMTDVEVVIPQFDHCVKLASKPNTVPGGLREAQGVGFKARRVDGHVTCWF